MLKKACLAGNFVDQNSFFLFVLHPLI